MSTPHIDLRPDIAVQLSHNERPILVDCLGKKRFIANAPTWELLRAMNGANGSAGVLERLKARGLATDSDREEVAALVDQLAPQWLNGPIIRARAREQASLIQAEKLQKLARLIDFARKKVPWYRSTVAKDSVDILIQAMREAACFDKVPPLTKDMVRAQFPSGLLAEGMQVGELLKSGAAQLIYSSGTTMDGDRTPSLHLATVDELNCNSPFGIYNAAERRVRFSTPRCTGRECYIELQSKAKRTYENSLILNSSANPMFMPKAALFEVVAELNEWAPAVISGNPWYLATLLRFMECEKLPLPSTIVAVLFGTEFVPTALRQYVGQRAGLVPFDNYSATEVGNVATTCPLGSFHIFDSVYAEVICRGRPARAGEVGEIFVTNLDQLTMPMLRYKLGDLATPLTDCACGLPQVALVVEGRIMECVLTKDDFLTPRQLDAEMSQVEGLLFYRVTQERDLQTSLEVIAAPSYKAWGAEVAQAAAECMRALGVNVREVRNVEGIRTRESMKFSLVISKIPELRTEIAKRIGNG